MLLYVELLGLIAASGYFASMLFVPAVIPETVSSEHALLQSSQ